MSVKDLRTAASLHFMYRAMAENETQTFSNLKSAFPLREFKEHARLIWQYGMLAELWGRTATALCKGRIDYLAKWRSGR